MLQLMIDDLMHDELTGFQPALLATQLAHKITEHYREHGKPLGPNSQDAVIAYFTLELHRLNKGN